MLLLESNPFQQNPSPGSNPSKRSNVNTLQSLLEVTLPTENRLLLIINLLTILLPGSNPS